MDIQPTLPTSPLTSLQPDQPTQAPGIIIGRANFTDIQLADKFKTWKKESFDQRHVYERQWLRNVWYYLNRQWIYFDSRRGQWQDKRLAKWVPRPVTNLVKDGVSTIRANFATINYATSSRPVGNDPKNILTASVADAYLPVLYEDHGMSGVMDEFDFWLLLCGNAWLHTCVDYDRKNGVTTIPHETCAGCGQDFPGNKIAEAGQACPSCKGTDFTPTVGPDGLPVSTEMAKPKGITIPLSPFEVAFPLMYERYDLAPYTIRMRWRDKTWYEGSDNDEMRKLAKTLTFAKSPAERTMQIFKALPFQNDMGFAPAFLGLAGSGASAEAEGVTEYDVWVKPCEEFKDGAVLRFAGDSDPIVIHNENEKLPGELPYHDAKGNPLFTFAHAEYDHVGGRSIGSSLVDPIIQKQDQLNQVDSLVQMIIMRTANPIWLEPKGAEVEKFTGEPGLVVKWNPLIAGGQAKPERIPGENVPATIFQYRTLLKEEIEELMGTFDILKGQKPSGVDAFSTTNLLLERGLARHAPAFKSRSAAHKKWAKFALEIEREFGDPTRTKAVMSKTKGWAFEVYQQADLSGDIEVIVEDSTTSAKTGLAERAAVEHLSQLQLLNPGDSAQVYEIYRKFGCTDLLPGLDGQVQECSMLLDRFEKLMSASQTDPMQQAQVGQAAQLGASPIPFQPWYNPQVFKQETVNWCVSDAGRNVLQNPTAITFITAFLAQIDQMLAMAAMAAAGPQKPGNPPNGGTDGGKPGGGGAGRSMSNSNQNSAEAGKQSSGSIGKAEPLQAAA